MIETIVLQNGLRVFLEKMPHLRSVSVGIWVQAGSMLETPETGGMSHMLEHLSFKGTEKRSTRQLAEDIDLLGGHINAATGKTMTTYYAHVLDDRLDGALELLSDIVLSETIDRDELEKERNVILEEIAMAEDMPEDIIFDRLSGLMYRGQTLSGTILGERERIETYSREELLTFRHRYYVPRNAVLVVVGSFERQSALAAIEQHFSGWKDEGERAGFEGNIPNHPSGYLAENRSIEQVHLCMGFSGVAEESKEVYPLTVLSSILGGGMSSRLFQRIREERGLVYNVYSSPAYYPGCGDFVVYAAAAPKNTAKVCKEVLSECERLIEGGVTLKEMEQTKVQLKTGIAISQESVYRRMNRIGNRMVLYDQMETYRQMIQRIDAVRPEDVLRIAKKILNEQPSVVLIGRDAQKIAGKLYGGSNGQFT